MTQEDKQLLLVDLCARLPYGVKVKETWWEMGAGTSMDSTLDINVLEQFINDEDMDVFPYLRPMSSMTEEEREDFWKNVLDVDWRELDFGEEPDVVPFPFTENDCGFYLDFTYLADLFAVFDWLNAHHFDFRNLLAKGLAIEVTEEFNPYKD